MRFWTLKTRGWIYPSAVLWVSKLRGCRCVLAAQNRFLWVGCCCGIRYLRFLRLQGRALALVVEITLLSWVQADTWRTSGSGRGSRPMCGAANATNRASAAVPPNMMLFLFISYSFHKKDDHLRDITQIAVLVSHNFKCYSCSQSETVDKAFHSSDSIDQALCIDQIKEQLFLLAIQQFY